MPYSETSLEAAIAAVRVHHAPLPDAFRWAGRAHRGGMEADAFEAAWPRLTLEQRVGHAAILIGPSSVPGPEATITEAYMDLCRRNCLQFNEPSEDIAAPGFR